MERKNIEVEIAVAKRLIRDARVVLLTHQVTNGNEYSSRLLHIVDHLLSDAEKSLND